MVMTKRLVVAIVFCSIMLICFIASCSCKEVSIASGDHLEMTFQNDGLVQCVHTILATSNDTVNATFSGTYSFVGNLVGNVTYEYSPEVHWHEVWFGNKSAGSAEIIINYNATLEPSKFTSITLKYRVKGILNKVNNTWFFRQSFNLPEPYTMEVVAKVPKPAFPWDMVETENVVPSPQVFLEESGYYVLVWKNPLFSTEQGQTLYIELSYRIVPNTTYWTVLLITSSISAIIGGALGYLWKSLKAQKQIIDMSNRTKDKKAEETNRPLGEDVHLTSRRQGNVNNNEFEALLCQYRECWGDIRQYDNLIWQIPSATTIITGVLVAFSSTTTLFIRAILFLVAFSLNLVMTIALYKHQFFRVHRFREIEKIQDALKNLGIRLIADGATSTDRIKAQIEMRTLKDMPRGWFYNRIAYNWIRWYMHLLTIVLVLALVSVIVW